MTQRSLNDGERLASLRLARTPNIGPVTFAGLMARFGSALAAIDAVPRLARRGGASAPLRIASADDARRELDSIAKLNGRIVIAHESDYPAGLAALDAPPPVLTIIGHPVLLGRDMVAIVGRAQRLRAGSQIRRPTRCRSR